MKLKLTERELSMLVELVYAGEWVINSCRLPNQIVKPYRDMRDYLLTLSERSEDREISEINSVDTNVFESLNPYFNFFETNTMLRTLAMALAKFQHNETSSFECSLAMEAYMDELRKNYLKNVEIKVEPKSDFV